MEICPQCLKAIKSPHTRVVQDTCGHKKCRLCLIKDEEECSLCAPVDKKEHDGKVTVHLSSRTRRHRKQKILTQSPQNVKTPLPVPLISKENIDVVHEHEKEDFKGFDIDASLSTEESSFNTKVEIESDDENQGRQSSDDGGDISDIKAECDETEAMETKTEKKRKKMFIASNISIAQGNPPLYTCTVCVKTFRRREHIRYHNYCATGEKPFTCEFCGQGFAAKAHYECHVLSHTGFRPYVCEICTKGFKQKDKLARHLRIHTGEKPFVCQDCGKRFVAAYGLKSHQRTHTGEKPFVCPHCSRGFTEIVNLRKHLSVHTGEKNFTCEDCGKRFSYKWALIHHQKTHSHERPHHCETCSRSFTNNKDLKRHYTVHSETRPYNCTLCETKFRRKDNLERHMKNTHPETRMQRFIIPQHEQLVSNTIYKQTSKADSSSKGNNKLDTPIQESSCIKSNSSDNSKIIPDLSSTKRQAEVMISPKEGFNPVKSVSSIISFNGSVQNTKITDSNEKLSPFCDQNIKSVESTHATVPVNNTTVKLVPAHLKMEAKIFSGVKQMCIPGKTSNTNSYASFNNMLDSVQDTNILSSGPLFENIPEAKKQKSQAVPVINHPNSSSALNQPIIAFGVCQRTNSKETGVVEGSNCVPTITKTSNIQQPEVSNTASSGQKRSACNKEENCSSNQLPFRIPPSELHWRKRTVELLQQQQEKIKESKLGWRQRNAVLKKGRAEQCVPSRHGERMKCRPFFATNGHMGHPNKWCSNGSSSSETGENQAAINSHWRTTNAEVKLLFAIHP